MSNLSIKFWNPEHIFEGKGAFGLLVLNSAISHPDKVIQLWNKAQFRVLVDGGANRWHKLCKAKSLSTPLPHLISGDLDSIDKDILEFYRGHSDVTIVLTPDQNFTDFTKAIQLLSGQTDSVKVPKHIDSLVAYVEAGSATGRPDQIFANYESLFHALAVASLPPVFLISPKSIEWVLPKAKNCIQIPRESSKKLTLRCGLIPLVECHDITTSGFRWNVTNETLAFGKIVSTSNEFEKGAEVAEVTNPNQPLLFTLQMEPEN